jgi:hypothetical protein
MKSSLYFWPFYSAKSYFLMEILALMITFLSSVVDFETSFATFKTTVVMEAMSLL